MSNQCVCMDNFPLLLYSHITVLDVPNDSNRIFSSTRFCHYFACAVFDHCTATQNIQGK